MEFAATSITTGEPQTSQYVVPVRGIFNVTELKAFQSSQTYAELMHFVQACAESIRGFEFPSSSSSIPSAAAVAADCAEVDVASTAEGDVGSGHVISKLAEYLEQLAQWVDEIPPMKQPMRFGNKAFRDWHARLLRETPSYLLALLEPYGLSGAERELSAYLCSAFGNETRIDYGTGHEANFVLFLFCLCKLDVIPSAQLRNMMSIVFRSYIRTMRKLQELYVLEPAGSHGVWGLDDYHCLLFLFGASQLRGIEDLRPSDVNDPLILSVKADTFLYFEGIQ